MNIIKIVGFAILGLIGAMSNNDKPKKKKK